MVHVSKWVVIAFVSLAGLAFAQESGVPPGPRVPAAPERVEVEGEIRRVDTETELDEVVVTAPRRRGIELANGVHAYGSFTGAYVRNLGDVPVRNNANGGRLSDPDHNTFGLTYAMVGLARDVSGRNEVDFGFRVEVGVGRLVETALRNDGLFDSNEPIDLPQAYAQAQLPTLLGRPVTVRAGRMAGWFGHEQLDVSQNVNFSLGYLTAFGPKTFTGAGLGIELADGLSYEQYVGNGWEVVKDNNDSKTLGGALRYSIGDLSLRGSWILGAEGLHAGDKRWALGFDATYVSPIFRTEFRLAGLYGQEENGGLNDELARFGGLSFGVKQGFCNAGTYDCVSVALRGEWFRDQGGSRSGHDQTLAGLTATLEFRPVEALALRVEYRHDWSSRDVFLGSGSSSSSSSFGGEDEQDTISASMSLAF